MDYGLKHVCGLIVPKRCQMVNVSTIVTCLEESAFHPKDPWSVFKTFDVFDKRKIRGFCFWEKRRLRHPADNTQYCRFSHRYQYCQTAHQRMLRRSLYLVYAFLRQCGFHERGLNSRMVHYYIYLHFQTECFHKRHISGIYWFGQDTNAILT